MKRLKPYLFLSILILNFLPTSKLAAQNIRLVSDSGIAGYFANPVDGYVTCVGSFAELRRNHFHGGLDVRTGGKIGVPIKASADGYVSRINKSAYGYGNCIYIAHPNGYTTVYAHLDHFNPYLENWIDRVHYLEENFEINVYPKPTELIVKKGDIIAYSGNTGGSSGPHLHFEVRKTSTEAPTNPLLFKMDITEKLGPKFLSCYLHTYDADFIKTDGFLPYSYIGLPNGTTREVAPGKYALSAKIRDYFQSYGENMGVNYLEMYVNDIVAFQMNIEQFTFNETRYLNSIMDFAMYKKNGGMAYRFWKDEGNMLPWYPKKQKEYGIIDLPESQVEPVKITLKAYDVNMKETKLTFFLKVNVELKSSVLKRTDAPTDPMVKYDEDFYFNDAKALVLIPKYTVYNSMYFNHDIGSNSYGATLRVFDVSIPLHQYINVGLLIGNTVETDKNKLYIKYNNGGSNKACETVRNGNWLYAKGKETGEYSISADLTAPYIKALSTGYKGNFSFSISDGGTGIKSYRAEVDGNWLLLDFDGKYARLKGIATAERFGKGKHTFTLLVTDKVGNENKVTYTFYL